MSEVFRCDDKEMLVAYLYGEIDEDGRREVERHLRTCVGCARETETLQTVRQDLALWMPPEPDLGFVIVQKPVHAAATVLTPGRWVALGAMPAWAQVAAAILVVAAGAAIANLQVRYGDEGLSVRTGWIAPVGGGTIVPVSTAGVAAVRSDEPWQPALAALEQNLRQEIAQVRETGGPSLSTTRGAESAVDSAALMRRVQALVSASEERQREEVALRLTRTYRDWDLQRRGDIQRIEQRFGSLQGQAFKNEAGQREMMNLVRRVWTQPIP